MNRRGVFFLFVIVIVIETKKIGFSITITIRITITYAGCDALEIRTDPQCMSRKRGVETPGSVRRRYAAHPDGLFRSVG